MTDSRPVSSLCRHGEHGAGRAGLGEMRGAPLAWGRDRHRVDGRDHEADVAAPHGPKPPLIRTGRPCGAATNPARSLQKDARTCKIDYWNASRRHEHNASTVRKSYSPTLTAERHVLRIQIEPGCSLRRPGGTISGRVRQSQLENRAISQRVVSIRSAFNR